MTEDGKNTERVTFSRGYDVCIMAIDGTWRRDCQLNSISDTDAVLTVEGSFRASISRSSSCCCRRPASPIAGANSSVSTARRWTFISCEASTPRNGRARRRKPPREWPEVVRAAGAISHIFDVSTVPEPQPVTWSEHTSSVGEACCWGTSCAPEGRRIAPLMLRRPKAPARLRRKRRCCGNP